MGEMYTAERSELGSLGAQVVALVRRQPLLSAMAAMRGARLWHCGLPYHYPLRKRGAGL